MFKAGDLMTIDVIAVKKETSISEAMEIMAENCITGMPVINDDVTLANVKICPSKEVEESIFQPQTIM